MRFEVIDKEPYVHIIVQMPRFPDTSTGTLLSFTTPS